MIRAKAIELDGMKFTIPIAICKRCGYTWALREVVPPMCPKCRTSRWNDESGRPVNRDEVMLQIINRLSQLGPGELFTELDNQGVRCRDGGKCQSCGESDRSSQMQDTILEVHHIDGDRENNCGCNLVLLCKFCHRLVTQRKNG